MVQWIVNADFETCELFDQLRSISFNDRKKDDRLIQLVRDLKQKWSAGLKIERMATLGWNENDICQLLCELLENLPRLRKEYAVQVDIHGNPPNVNDKDFEKFEKAIRDEKKNF